MTDVPLFVDHLLGSTAGDPLAACAADLNGDNNIDGGDIELFAQALLNG